MTAITIAAIAYSAARATVWACAAYLLCAWGVASVPAALRGRIAPK